MSTRDGEEIETKKQAHVEEVAAALLAHLELAGDKGIWRNEMRDLLGTNSTLVASALLKLREAGQIIWKNEKKRMHNGKPVVMNKFYKVPPGYQPPPKPRSEPKPYFPYASSDVQRISSFDQKDAFSRETRGGMRIDHHRSEIPPSPIQITPHLALGLGIHFPAIHHTVIEPLDLLLRVRPTNEVVKDLNVVGRIDGPGNFDDAFYVYAIFAEDAFPDPGPLDELMAGAVNSFLPVGRISTRSLPHRPERLAPAARVRTSNRSRRPLSGIRRSSSGIATDATPFFSSGIMMRRNNDR